MAEKFEDIKITGVDTTNSGGNDGSSDLVDIVLTLSKSVSADWGSLFDSLWKQHIYMMRRPVRVSGSRMTIHCVPDELEKYHLSELKEITTKTNQKYKEYLAQRERDTQWERERAEAQKATIDKLNNINFD